MKVIGLIGGMSWESSLEYYRIINETVRARCGKLHSAKLLLYSVNFAEIEALQHKGEWDKAADIVVDAAQRLERGGADFLILCTNTMHKLADAIQSHVSIPLLHIADATAEAIRVRGIQAVGLLGTRFTMEEDFYKARLIERYGLEVHIPNAEQRQLVHNIIYNELCAGIVQETSRIHYRAIIAHLVADGAEGIILGCTEIGLLVSPDDSHVPLFDTTRIHAEAAVTYALKD